MGCYTNKAKCFVLFFAFLYLCVYSHSTCVELTAGNFVCDYNEGETDIFSDSISADTLRMTLLAR
ncbi:hypothetical protein Emin_0457 [Elusimicrobium minutum Pei191]|uniref:Uncharacterized protein n=1 Tax=Elusimicrobium minutum (strain Pei191) TaxID=445932 RepID=B2KBJ2_ELUMP|nr:hypothetical protein Emin_0457 [Elusimicrobium minutum Pei191]